MAKANDALAAGLRSGFTLGYRNREDVTVLPPNVLVSGSKNVLTNTFKRIGNRKGYSLDGQRDSASTDGVYGSFDWLTHIGTERNLRVGGNTTGTNGTLQFRYVATAGDKYLTNTFTEGQVYWIDLKTSVGSTFSACRFWDFTNELKDLMLYVDGTSNIFMWSGGVTTLKSRTANTLTLNSSGTWESNGFLGTATYHRKVMINGTEYTYTGGSSTDTLTGVTPDPSAEALNSVVFQSVYTKTDATITGIPAAFKNHIIENLNNQIYLSASDNTSVYISQANSFVSFSFTTPLRVVGEGALLTFDAVPTAMRQQTDTMFVSAGQDYWYAIEFTLDSTNAKEAVSIVPLKTTRRQAARSQDLAAKIKNKIAFVSFETQINTLGVSENFYSDPQVTDLSYPIVNDVNSYDFTGGSVAYFRKFLFVTAPAEGKMLIYNMTQDVTDGGVDASSSHYWEAPQDIPVGCLSVIGGELYGHDWQTFNTFKLFDGYNDDGHSYTATALFAYDSHGDRTATKSSNELFIEGYKTQSTKLTAYLRRNLNGQVAKWSWRLLPNRCIIPPTDDASIGKSPIGESPIGTTSSTTDPVATPPKFRLVQTFAKEPYYEEQVGFSSSGIDHRWEIVSFATNADLTTENQSQLYDPDLTS
jgi:hypothetical protein